MTCLHILNKGPDQQRFADCLSKLVEGDCLLLTENAVLALANSQFHPPPGVFIKALTPDLEARGVELRRIGPPCSAIDFPAYVNLTLESDKVVCW